MQGRLYGVYMVGRVGVIQGGLPRGGGVIQGGYTVSYHYLQLYNKHSHI